METWSWTSEEVWPQDSPRTLASYAILFARARIFSSVRDPWVRNAVIAPWIKIHSMDLVTKDGMQSMVNIAVRGGHRNLARYIRVSIPSMQISKILLPHRAHTLTVLSVTKPRPRPIDRHGFGPTVHPILSNKLSFRLRI